MTRPNPRRSHKEERAHRAAARNERARAAAAAAAEAEAAATAEATAAMETAIRAEIGPAAEPGAVTTLEARATLLAPAVEETTDAASALAMATPRDTGLTLRSRASRVRGPDTWLWPMVGIIVVVLAAGVAITTFTKRATPRAEVEQPVTVASALPTTVLTQYKRATPVFAHYRDIPIHLPVEPENVTTLAYHQASYADVLHMTSLIRDESFGQAIKASQERKAAKRAAKAKRATSVASTATSAAAAATSVSAAATGAPAVTAAAPLETDEGVWTGRAIRLWRSGRRGKPDSAADVGANPGTTVYSPVAGEVLMVERYKLYNKYDDYKIHIRPTGHSDIDVIVMHITNPAVVAGEKLEAGITPLAKVRRLSKYAALQLGSYSGDKGDHVHVQLNIITARLGLKPFLGQSETPDKEIPVR